MRERELAIKLRACGVTISDEEMRDPVRLRAVLNSVRESVSACSRVLARAHFGSGMDVDEAEKAEEANIRPPVDFPLIPGENNGEHLEPMFDTFEQFDETRDEGMTDEEMMEEFIDHTVQIMKYAPREEVTDAVLESIATPDGVEDVEALGKYDYFERIVPIAVRKGVDMKAFDISGNEPYDYIVVKAQAGALMSSRSIENIYNRYGLARLRPILDMVELDYSDIIDDYIDKITQADKYPRHALLREFVIRGGRVDSDTLGLFCQSPNLGRFTRELLPRLLSASVPVNQIQLSPVEMQTEGGAIIAEYVNRYRRVRREIDSYPAKRRRME